MAEAKPRRFVAAWSMWIRILYVSSYAGHIFAIFPFLGGGGVTPTLRKNSESFSTCKKVCLILRLLQSLQLTHTSMYVHLKI